MLHNGLTDRLICSVPLSEGALAYCCSCCTMSTVRAEMLLPHESPNWMHAT
jgi:hypothetical protein